MRKQSSMDKATSSLVNRKIPRSQGYFVDEEPSGRSSEGPSPRSSPRMERAGIEENDQRLEALRSLNEGGAGPPQPKSKPQAKSIQNPWNKFQHENAGPGWSKARMQEEYYKYRKLQQRP